MLSSFQVDFKQICPVCRISCENIHLTAKHISREHENCTGFSVKCLYCAKVFSHVKKWKRHVIEVHVRGGIVVSSQHSFVCPSTSRGSVSTQTVDTEVGAVIERDNCPDIHASCADTAAQKDDTCTGNQGLEHPANFLLKLKSSGLSDKHCDSLADYLKKYSYKVASECVSSIAKGDNPDLSNLPSLKALDEVRSSAACGKYASRNLLCVSPCEVLLGKSDAGKSLSFQYISLTSQLQSLFASKRFQEHNLLESESRSNLGVYRDIFDGTCHQREQNRISLILFF